jgi:hypothetical protein
MTVQSVADAFAETNGQQQVEQKDLTLLAKLYLLIRAKVDQESLRLHKLKADEAQAEAVLMQAMEQAGLKTIKLKDGPAITCAEKHYFALPAKDTPGKRQEALAWLRRVGAKALVELSINANSMSAFCRERLEARKPISPLIKETVLKCLSVTQPK